MKITELAKEPELTKIVLDDESIITKYGEAVEFYTLDRQPLDIFLKMASVKHDDPASMISSLKPMLLDENGKEIIDGKKMLPTDILMAAVSKLISQMGN